MTPGGKYAPPGGSHELTELDKQEKEPVQTYSKDYWMHIMHIPCELNTKTTWSSALRPWVETGNSHKHLKRNSVPKFPRVWDKITMDGTEKYGDRNVNNEFWIVKFKGLKISKFKVEGFGKKNKKNYSELFNPT